MPSASPADRSAAQWAAPLFVLLWSTGFIGAKFGLPYAEPLTFLCWRYLIVLAALLAWTLLSGAPWPERRLIPHLAVVGALLHGVYLGAVFCAISLGVEAGVAALIVGTQPILSAVLAHRMLGERMTTRQKVGLALGLAGVTLVVAHKLGDGVGDWRGAALCLGALVAISWATLYQKKHCAGAPLRSGAVVQFAAALALTAPLALALETNVVRWTGEFAFALGWLVLVLSLGAIALLMRLLREGAAGAVASLFFLVPPCTALIAWAMFGETPGPLALIGGALAVTGVALTMRGAPPAKEPAR